MLPSLKNTNAKLSQTEIDHLELDSTDVSPATAKFFSWVFVAVLFAVPISQMAMEVSHFEAPHAMDLFTPFAAGFRQAAGGRWRQAWDAWEKGIQPQTLHGYEGALENRSIHKSFFQPRMQEVLTGFFGVGNEKVVIGRDGWIFYQPGLEYVVSPSVIEASTLDLAAKKMVNKGIETSPYPDPRPALLQLHRDCRKAGIHLVVFPVPDKVMLQPAQLYRGFQSLPSLPVANNVGYRRLKEQMRREGADWFDAIPGSIGLSDVRYLRQDTHWSPEFMDSVARDLAHHIRQLQVLPQIPPVRWTAVEEHVSRVGDLVDMLKLTSKQTVFSPQAVTVQRVLDANSGRSFEPDPDADVLLLGDSFTNVYSLRDMGWGRGAGFAEHLAYRLQRRIDVIAFNGGGASRTRVELARPENAERLGHKKVIIYEFAIRDLLGESWKPIPMIAPRWPMVTSATAAPSNPNLSDVPHSRETGVAPTPSLKPVNPVTPPPPAPRSSPELVVVGRILQTSNVPAPGTAPYKDCLTFVKMHVDAVESGSYSGQEILVAFLAMRDNQWLPAARYGIGDHLRMTLIPLSKTEEQIRTMQRADDTEDLTLRPYYALRETRP